MIEICGIQFKNGSRLYYFSPNGYTLKVGDYAIVETVRGVELGKVTIGNRLVEDDEIDYELKPIIHPATKDEIEKAKQYEKQAPHSFKLFKECVNELELPMKPLYAEYTLDGSKVVFYYTADDRVDFRELLKLLTPKFKCRVELRQIGSREAARYIGGIGNCGRVICCKSCLNSSDFVTMKMAKDQNMSLNKDKINGLCEKLLCCIAYEHEIYMALKKELPEIGEIVRTPNSDYAKVISVDYMKKLITVKEEGLETNSIYPVNELKDYKVSNPHIEPGLEKVITSNNKEEIKEEVKTNDSNKKVYVVNKNKFFNKKKKK